MGAPSVTTLPNVDTDVSPTIVSAAVFPNGLDTHVWFVWGPDLEYFYTTPSIDVGAAASAVASAAISTSSGTYHFAAVAQNSAGTTFGGDQTFDVKTTFTEGILDSASAWTAFSQDLTNYLTGLGQMFEDSYGIVISQGNPDDDDYEPGWSTLLNVDETDPRFLPYLGKFVGVNVPPGTDAAIARSKIKNEAGFGRGTPAVMLAAADRNLVNSHAVLVERLAGDQVTPDPYHVVIGYDSSACPDRQRMINDVEAVKPAGIQITYGDLTSGTWAAQTETWAGVVGTWGQI